MKPFSLLAAGLALLTACGSTAGSVASGESTGRARALKAYDHCGTPSGGANVRWIGNPQQLAQVWQQIGRDRLGGPPLQEIEDVDFTREGIVLIEMGVRSTAGYALELASPVLTIRSETAILTVNRIEPGPGAMLAQVVTSPCLLVAVPRASIEKVRVVDGESRVAGEVSTRP